MTNSALDTALVVLEKLDDAVASDVSAFAVTQTADGSDAVSSVGLSGGLKAEFLVAAKAKAESLRDLSPRPYGPAVELSRGEVMWVAGDTGTLSAIDPLVDAGDVDVYSQPTGDGARVRMLVVRVRVGDVNVKFYREIASSAWLAQSKKVALFWADGHFDKIDSKNVLIFDGAFDAVVVDGFALFTAKYKFERIFSFGAEIARQSRETLTKITKNLRIRGYEEMERACTTNPGMMAKLASVARRMQEDAGYAGAMTMDNLVPFVHEHPETGVEVIGEGANSELVFYNDPGRRFKILRLLDDDFLHSELTQNTYEANSKSDALR